MKQDSIIAETNQNLQKQLYLEKFKQALHDDFEEETIDNKFSTLADLLLNYLYLVVSGQNYKITEIEFYYYDKNRHPDPYVHRAKEQGTAGKWYFNGAGLDITFGNAEKSTYGGILIRGLKKPGKYPCYISGPSNALREIFSSIGHVTNNEGGISLQEPDITDIPKDKIEPARSVRIGLIRKVEDKDDFLSKKYRYIVELNAEHKFRDKEIVIRQLLDAGKISNDQAYTMLGYNLRLNGPR